MKLGLGLKNLRQFKSAGFSPLSLSPTAWYDPSDLSTLFQDSAGTTPVTASGQPVGRMLDKSGNGYHLLQATSTQRPIYTVAGGFSFLLLDGVDDYMDAATAFSPSMAQPNSIALALRLLTLNPAGSGTSQIYDDAIQTNREALIIAQITGQPQMYAGALPNAGAAVSANTDYVMTQRFDGAASYNRINGTQATTSASPGTQSMDKLRLGAFNATGSGASNIRFYGGIIRDNPFNTSEQGQVETYLGGKCGVVL